MTSRIAAAASETDRLLAETSWIRSLACELLGGETRARYRDGVLARVRATQREDGSFGDLHPGSPDSMQLMSDERTDRAYRTALYAAALAHRGEPASLARTGRERERKPRR